eukprot:snap_masked-scaffold71_size417697-processed-gene-0.4 protein:Tk11795 transcript:snap_masked-scaffold71_size417697-processed-gene-0.4-mRNA-1 annotation:"GM10981"
MEPSWNRVTLLDIEHCSQMHHFSSPGNGRNMHHQWVEGNLAVSSKCVVCDKNCGSVLRLQDWRCLWCRATVHTMCRSSYIPHCSLGPTRHATVPPIRLIKNDVPKSSRELR